jgi:signal transduction histidine kinase
MGFFRNPEIKLSLKIYFFLTLLATCVGLFLDVSCFILVLFICMIFTFTHLLFSYKRYKGIAKLGLEIDRVLHNKDSIELSEYSEGELAILQNQILKLTVKLREQAYALKQDKIYLADSIADISHQIRTPLTSINIILSILSQSRISEERRQEYIKELEKLILRIDWLISALLKIAKLDAGTARFQRETVNVSQLLKKATSTIAVQMELKNQQLQVRLNGDEKYVGDIFWSAEAIENILKNCMEHTQNGGIISISASENVLYTEIIISDNGCGIAKKDLPNIFERFYKGNNSTYSSFGIGLALARMIIINQNGTIKAENAQNGGARFIIRFYKGTV